MKKKVVTCVTWQGSVLRLKPGGRGSWDQKWQRQTRSKPVLFPRGLSSSSRTIAEVSSKCTWNRKVTMFSFHPICLTLFWKQRAESNLKKRSGQDWIGLQYFHLDFWANLVGLSLQILRLWCAYNLVEKVSDRHGFRDNRHESKFHVTFHPT